MNPTNLANMSINCFGAVIDVEVRNVEFFGDHAVRREDAQPVPSDSNIAQTSINWTAENDFESTSFLFH